VPPGDVAGPAQRTPVQGADLVVDGDVPAHAALDPPGQPQPVREAAVVGVRLRHPLPAAQHEPGQQGGRQHRAAPGGDQQQPGGGREHQPHRVGRAHQPGDRHPRHETGHRRPVPRVAGGPQKAADGRQRPVGAPQVRHHLRPVVQRDPQRREQRAGRRQHPYGHQGPPHPQRQEQARGRQQRHPHAQGRHGRGRLGERGGQEGDAAGARRAEERRGDAAGDLAGVHRLVPGQAGSRYHQRQLQQQVPGADRAQPPGGRCGRTAPRCGGPPHRRGRGELLGHGRRPHAPRGDGPAPSRLAPSPRATFPGAAAAGHRGAPVRGGASQCAAPRGPGGRQEPTARLPPAFTIPRVSSPVRAGRPCSGCAPTGPTARVSRRWGRRRSARTPGSPVGVRGRIRGRRGGGRPRSRGTPRGWGWRDPGTAPTTRRTGRIPRTRRHRGSQTRAYVAGAAPRGASVSGPGPVPPGPPRSPHRGC
jgi:hypothetical protein